jgi:hypothetical protein
MKEETIQILYTIKGIKPYEAMKCSCGLTVDHNGIHLE